MPETRDEIKTYQADSTWISIGDALLAALDRIIADLETEVV